MQSSVMLAAVAPGLISANGDGKGAAAAQAVTTHASGMQTSAYTFNYPYAPGTGTTSPIDLGGPGRSNRAGALRHRHSRPGGALRCEGADWPPAALRRVCRRGLHFCRPGSGERSIAAKPGRKRHRERVAGRDGFERVDHEPQVASVRCRPAWLPVPGRAEAQRRGWLQLPCGRRTPESAVSPPWHVVCPRDSDETYPLDLDGRRGEDSSRQSDLTGRRR